MRFSCSLCRASETSTREKAMNGTWACARNVCFSLLLAAALIAPARADAAAPIRGVRTMGHGSPPPSAPPRSSYGNTPNDYRRGYEGNSPSPGDPWGREADFKARNYEQRHNPLPPAVPSPQSPAPAPAPGYPSSPKPPLPGDRDFQTAPPAAGSNAAAP